MSAALQLRPNEVLIGTNEGPQSDAFASSADITVYGGAAGGGKTHLALLRFGVHADQHAEYYGAIFRREMPMIKVGGGLWEESMKLYPGFGAHPNLTDRDWRFARRSMLQFRSLQHEADVLHYQGAQFAEFCLEEATHFTEFQFWYLFSRLRSVCGMKPRCLLTCNPDPDSWVRRLVDWYIGKDGYPIRERVGKKRYFVRDGDELVWGDSPDEVRALAPHITCDPNNQPKSLRFIPAKLADNPKGDPTYESRLNALPLVERARLKGGNWNIRAAAGLVFKRSWFEIVDSAPSDVMRIGRYWDLAATEPNQSNQDPDWSRGVKMSRHRSGLFVVHGVASTRARQYDVEKLVTTTAQQDGRGVALGFWKDPGSAGKSEADRYVRMMAGWDVRAFPASKDKLTLAKPASSQAEAGNIKLVRGNWNEAYLNEHESFDGGDKGHDDIVDAESLGMLDLTTAVEIKALNVRGIR